MLNILLIDTTWKNIQISNDYCANKIYIICVWQFLKKKKSQVITLTYQCVGPGDPQ